MPHSTLFGQRCFVRATIARVDVRAIALVSSVACFDSSVRIEIFDTHTINSRYSQIDPEVQSIAPSVHDFV